MPVRLSDFKLTATAALCSTRNSVPRLSHWHGAQAHTEYGNRGSVTLKNLKKSEENSWDPTSRTLNVSEHGRRV